MPRLHQTKSGAPRRVPLSQIAITTIREILAETGRSKAATHLFVHDDGTRFGDFKKGFNAAYSRAKISGMRWHDLRHTFASWFIQQGGDLSHLSRILGLYGSDDDPIQPPADPRPASGDGQGGTKPATGSSD